VLAVIPSLWLYVEGANRRSYTHITISGIGGLEKEESRASTHELARSRVVKGACVKALVRVLWSLGGGEAHALCMFAQVWFLKDLWIGFVEGFSKEPKESLRLVEELERSCADLGPRVGVH
jgi:hypothetical protein